MPKWVRVVAIVVGSVAALAGVLLGAAYGMTRSKLSRRYDISPELLSVAPPQTQDSARGFAMVVAHACTHCHSQDLGGAVMPEMASFGTVVAPDLTRSGIAARYTDQDWARTIRHSVKPDGTPVLLMPSNHNYLDMADEDVAAIIQYARTLPPANRKLPETSFNPAGYAALASGLIPLETEFMDHTVRPYRTEPGVTINNGRHLAQMCTSCHANDLAGVPPGLGHDRPGTNLTPAGPMKDWTEAGFVRFMRTGDTPAGRHLDPRGMPWKAFSLLRDDELKSLWAYIHSVPPVDRSVRRGAAKKEQNAAR